MEAEKRKVTPERMVKLLAEQGKEVTLEEAKQIVEFMYLLAQIVVKKYVKP